jgi:hypothetical protein
MDASRYFNQFHSLTYNYAFIMKYFNIVSLIPLANILEAKTY